MLTDNERIAKFMGLEFSAGLYSHVDWEGEDWGYEPENLMYHKSWDWLMPVVEKISRYVYESWEDSNGYENVTHHERAYPRTFGMMDTDGKWLVRINRMPLEQEGTLIQATYKAVVEFIKYFETRVGAE